MKTRRSPHLLTATALAGLLMLAACGGGSGEAPPAALGAAADTTGPVVTITDSVPDGTATGNVTFTFTFNEDVGTSFTADDITVTGGSKVSFTRVDGTRATLVVAPTANAVGTIALSVPANAALDAVGNGNAVTSSQQAFNTVVPAEPGSTGTCTTASCIDFAAASVGVEAFEGLGFGGVADDPALAGNKVLKLTKVPAGQPWAGATVYTDAATKSVGTIGFAGSKVVTLRVYSPAVGTKIRLKVEDAADPTVSMEKDALSTKANAWETLTFDFTTPDNGSYNAARTYNRVSVFPAFLVPVTASTDFFFDELKLPASATGGGTATRTTIDFSGAAVALENFEGLGSGTIVADPTNAANLVARLVKVPAGQPWAGTTVYTDASNKSVGAIGFASSKVITMRVYSPGPGKKIMLKVENASDGAVAMEAQATTTATNAWETLSFDFAAPSAGSYDASKTYNKVSIFPDFLVAATADTVYLFDDIVYPTAATTGGGGGGGTATGLVNLVGGVFASNYTESPTPWKSVEGGTAGRYVDTSVATQDWWSGLAATDATPSFYFGYGLNSNAKPWGFGAYVSAPNDGVANVAPYTSLRLAVWGNDQLVNTRPTFTIILKGPTVAGCTSELKGSLAVTGAGVQTYSLPLSGFTLQTACAYASAAAALAGGVSQVHIQVLGANVQYSAGADASSNFPNGLNVGPIRFE